MKKTASFLFCGIILMAGLVSPALAITLPSIPNGYVDGIQTAVLYDDFWSYSNQILRTIQKANPTALPISIYGDFDFATGTGGLDVILYTGAGTKDRNQNVGPDGADAGNKGDFDFEDPAAAPGGGISLFSGWWGQNDQDNNGAADNVNGSVTVGQVLEYLHALNPDNSIPFFYMDLNQTGKNDAVLFSGEVLLINPTTNSVVHSWAFDNHFNPGDGSYNPDAPAIAAGVIGPLVSPISGINYGLVDHNLGSGKADFIAFAPTMDLSLFDSNLLFVTHFTMANLDNGFEEIYLTGGISLAQPIPEAGTLLLLGSGLLGLGLLGRRSLSK